MSKFSKIRPVKFLGQNYLHDKNIIRKIVDEINPAEGENLIEIGPGKGALTGAILERVPALTAVEIDRRVIDELRSTYPGLRLIEGDFKTLPFEELKSENEGLLRFAGNIPYSLTSPILFKLLNNRQDISDAVLMVQYEVAQRITGARGTKEYGILSVLLNTFADSSLCFKVSPNVFYPRPKVASAIIHLHFKHNNSLPEDTKYFIHLVKAAFSKRRKILSNSLAGTPFAFLCEEEPPVDFSLRPEQLTLDDFTQLYRFAKTKKDIVFD